MTTNSRGINPIIGSSSLKYKDISPIAHLSGEDLVFTVRQDSSLKTAHGLVDRLKKDPAGLTFGIATTLGNSSHIAIAQAARAAVTDVRHIRVIVFNVLTEAMTTVLGAQLNILVSSPGKPMPHMQDGKLRALAVSAPTRLSGTFASTPNGKELSISSMANDVAIAGVPRPTLAKFHAAITYLTT